MRNNWIIDVLADLKAFAVSNELPKLAEQLDDAAIIAMTEIAVAGEEEAESSYGFTNDDGGNPGVARVR